MANESGKASDFVWYELHTPDAGTADEFYGKVVGWTSMDAQMPNQKYLVVSIGQRMVGGLLEKPKKEFAGGMKPMWVGYIGVENADAAAESVVKAGGVVHKAAEDIPNIGRYAVVADPQGAIFVVFQPYPMQPPPEPAPDLAGTFGWSQLDAADGVSAFDFYAAQYGWTKSGTFDMGAAGVYQMFNAEGERMIGGMMTRMDPSEPPQWLYFINVEDANVAVARVKEGGGTVLNGPNPVPGGQLVATCVDPQGAKFGVVGPRP